MYRIVVECLGVPAHEGDAAAADIENEFREHRPHHQNVLCTFEDGRLALSAENSFDPEGLVLLDELSDCISAYVSTLFDGSLRVTSTTIV